MTLSSGLALKSPIIIWLSIELERKSSISVRESKKYVSESKCGFYIDIRNHFCFLKFNSEDKASILNWNFGKESWPDGIVALKHN